MKKSLFFSFNKYFLAMLLSASVVFFTSCGDDDSDDSSSTPTPTGSTDKTIAELAGETAGLDSLYKQLSNFSDLVSLLSDTSATYTVFAPNNQAFVNLLATPGFPSTFETINPDIIKGVLSYHVVAGQKIMSSDLGPEMNTLYTDPNTQTVQTIQVNSDGTLLTGSTNQAIKVVTADVEASNGVIHIVESVMIPPSVGATLTPILGTLAGTVLLGADFSDLATMIGIADDGQALTDRISSVLADTSNSYTVFAPSNQVFEAGSIDPTSFDGATARAILKNHVVLGLNLSSSLSVGDSLTTLTPSSLVISAPGGVTSVGLTDTTGVPIAVTDITTNNGVLHVIGGIIQ